MNHCKYAFLIASFSNLLLGMGEAKEYSIQDFLDSKPNYQVATFGNCFLKSIPETPNKFTSVKGIENIDGIRKMNRITLDGNPIRLEGSPFEGLNLACTVITLNACGLTSLNPTFFEGLTKLQRLELKDNAIKHLPENWGTLTQLKELSLERNPLTDEQLLQAKKALPNAIIWVSK